MKTIPINEEHLEAHQVEVSTKLDKFKATLPQNKQDAMNKIIEAVGVCEENDVPLVFFAQFVPDGFHQWNSFKDENNKFNKFTQDYHKAAWENIRKFINAALHFIMPMYFVRIKMYSLQSKELLLDTHPED